MQIEYKRGNVALAEEKYIAHGCNMQHVMGSGVAKEIRRVYPRAYTEYMEHELYLGKVIIVYTKDKAILNCITQEFYGKDGKQYASYDAVKECLKTINRFVIPGSKVAMPRIGCGLGGLEWGRVSKLIEDYSIMYSVVVYDL